MIGRTVGNYKITEALGQGGAGVVYKAIDTMLDRDVAIKVLRPDLASQTSVVERFRSEAVVLARLSHPNVATLYSLFRQTDELFMVLEFIPGETLDRMLHRRGALPVSEALGYFSQALEGISYAHERGVVHRDIKPGNIMLNDEGIVKVLDFGIARLLGSDRVTRHGNVVGTLEYMSPEQVRGVETDARSDVYGLGIMLYEMVTGRLPFESENDFELMKMQTEMQAAAPRSIDPAIPGPVENAILKAMSKSPDERFANAGEFLDSLNSIGLPNANVGFTSVYKVRRSSRPSNPGLAGEDGISPKREAASAEIAGHVSSIGSASAKREIPPTFEVGGEIRKEETHLDAFITPTEHITSSGGKTTRLASSAQTEPIPETAKPSWTAALAPTFKEGLARFAELSSSHKFHKAAFGLSIFGVVLASAAVLPFLFFDRGQPGLAPKNAGREAGAQGTPVIARDVPAAPTRDADTTREPEARTDVRAQQPVSTETPLVSTPADPPSQPAEPTQPRASVPNQVRKQVPSPRPPRQPASKGRSSRLRDLMTGH